MHGNSKGVDFFQNTTVRIVALVSCAIIALVILAPVARNYIKQYNANSDLKAQIAAQQAENEELRNNLSRWEDNNYVIAQARERLTFVFPGETPYRVMGWDSQDLEEIAPENTSPALFPDQKMPWYEELLGSVQQSGAIGDRESVSVNKDEDSTTDPNEDSKTEGEPDKESTSLEP